jgi:hypothetical protein
MTAYLTSYDYLMTQDTSDDETVYSDEEAALDALEDIDNEWDDIENEEDIDEGIGLVDEIYERIELLDSLQTYGDAVYGGYMSMFTMVY